jgi:nucleoside-diphosphate-sugar epimerase
MKLSGKQVLVTGATGFVGGRLVEKLVIEQHANVRVLIRNFSHASRIARFDIEMVSGDITDSSAVTEATKGCEVIFHCAYDFRGPRKDRQRVTFVGTENVAKAALKTGSRLVHVSTVDVYGWPHQETLDETAPKSPDSNLYAQTKFRAEEFLWSYHRQHAFPLVVVQPTIVYGPFSRPWTLSVIDQLKNGRLELGEEDNGVCNAVYIDDVADALILAATEPRAVGEAFLISGPDVITWKEFYAAFEKLLGRNGTGSISPNDVKRVSSSLSSLEGRVIDAAMESSILRRAYEKSRLFLPDHINGLIRSTVLKLLAKNAQLNRPLDKSRLKLYRTRCHVKLDKARRLLGYKPAFSFERGMVLTGQFLRWADLIPANEDVRARQSARPASHLTITKQTNGAEFLSL